MLWKTELRHQIMHEQDYVEPLREYILNIVCDIYVFAIKLNFYILSKYILFMWIFKRKNPKIDTTTAFAKSI